MWQPGESGNPNGRPVEKPFIEQIRKLCKQEDYKRLHSAADKLLDMASDGESWAIQVLADRLDGKPKQQVEHSTDPDRPLILSLDLGERVLTLLDKVRGEK